MSASASEATESPRAVADKREKRTLLRAIRMALRVEGAAVRQNTQTFNRNRYTATAALPDYQQLKDRARKIKEESVAGLPELLAVLQASVQRNGGHFYLAADAQDAARYIAEVCRLAGVRGVVKGKSMTSEEVHLNLSLEKLGIDVAETDLAEFILQVADEQPSHIVAPAIHYSRERISALFQRVFRTSEPLETGEELTRFARERLRGKFLTADCGITGANLVIADSGSLVLVESEANIRMSTLLPPLHIALAGVEKVIPSRRDLAPFIELLAASGTGQPMTSYTSVITPPLAAPVLSEKPAAAREFHLVLVDNGRMKMREDRVLREALYCIRCSACMNCCANFQAVGGHAFGGETYAGGIGGAWEAGTRSLEHARFAELCTGCSRCVTQCPVQIDIPWLNENLRHRLAQHDAGSGAAEATPPAAALPADDRGTPLQKLFFGRYDFFGRLGAAFAPISNWVNALPLSRIVLEKTAGIDRRRHLPPFARKTMVELCRRELRSASREKGSEPAPRVVLFADAFTNYGSPHRGVAALRVLRALGVDVTVSECVPDGRAPLSQGMVATAARQARGAADYLMKFVSAGRDVVVVEPSVLAMFRRDYHHLLAGHDGELRFAEIKAHTFDAIEYVWKVIAEQKRDVAGIFSASRHAGGRRLFFHAHCQQKTVGAAAPAEELLRAAGFDVVTSQVECCGMAGSFGYKREFYDVSMSVAGDLFAQVRRADGDGPQRTLVASGISCQEQLHGGLGRPVWHPLEVLAAILPRAR